MEWLYLLFNSFYDQNLELYLQGYDGSAFVLPLLYDTIGLTTVGASLFFVVFYYYGLNHPRFDRWWGWTIIGAVNAIACFFIGHLWTLSHYNNGSIPQSLVYYTNPSGNQIQVINEASCLGFGISNMIISIIIFFVLSFMLKWWSSNCKHSPFL